MFVSSPINEVEGSHHAAFSLRKSYHDIVGQLAQSECPEKDRDKIEDGAEKEDPLRGQVRVEQWRRQTLSAAHGRRRLGGVSL
ncbi:MAG: hypothetical protein AVDCRST_MAG19-2805 [uncultured Thermomicrobiales bacterium]|uniref:Uncharacterized protein n=1 Tax=uncultured Thermomicrobiales bacterium TaxID=1645740 RepID=A0A6J4V8N9_9BACT|nr:MAG: hypothetical protein AVDCRST_MAG19-2805 [uncultured Thermomicrobiales bacterium]